MKKLAPGIAFAVLSVLGSLDALAAESFLTVDTFKSLNRTAQPALNRDSEPPVVALPSTTVTAKAVRTPSGPTQLHSIADLKHGIRVIQVETLPIAGANYTVPIVVTKMPPEAEE
jgi:hypothetical protein